MKLSASSPKSFMALFHFYAKINKATLPSLKGAAAAGATIKQVGAKAKERKAKAEARVVNERREKEASRRKVNKPKPRAKRKVVNPSSLHDELRKAAEKARKAKENA